MLVLDDADLARAVDGALWASFLNCGQVCSGVERIYVERALYEPFVEELARRRVRCAWGRRRPAHLRGRARTCRTSSSPMRSPRRARRTPAARPPIGPVVLRADGALRGRRGRAARARGDLRAGRERRPRARRARRGRGGERQPVRARRIASGRVTPRVPAASRRVCAPGSVWHNDHAYSYATAQASWGGRGGSGFGRTHSKHGLYELSNVEVRRPRLGARSGAVVVPLRRTVPRTRSAARSSALRRRCRAARGGAPGASVGRSCRLRGGTGDERVLACRRVGRGAHGRRRREAASAPARRRARGRPDGAGDGRAGSSALPKGDALTTAQLAGIMAAKRTADLIPLCHPLPLTHVGVALEVGEGQVEITASAETTAQTGVEMEALTAASVAALTVYDMAKAVDKQMTFSRRARREDEGVNAAVLTVSDRVSRGEAEDRERRPARRAARGRRPRRRSAGRARRGRPDRRGDRGARRGEPTSCSRPAARGSPRGT